MSLGIVLTTTYWKQPSPRSWHRSTAVQAACPFMVMLQVLRWRVGSTLKEPALHICVINLWLYIAVEVVDHGDSVIICSILQWEWWITVTVSPGCRPRGWAGHSGYTSASSARDRCTKTKMYLIHLLLRKVKYTLTKDQGCGSGSGSALIFPPGSGST